MTAWVNAQQSAASVMQCSMAPAELTCALQVHEHVVNSLGGQLRQPLTTQAWVKPHPDSRKVCAADLKPPIMDRMKASELTCALQVGEHVLHIIRGQLWQPLATQARLEPHLYSQQICAAGSGSKLLQENGGCAHNTFRSSPIGLSLVDDVLPGSCLYSAHLGHDLPGGNAKGKAHVPDSEFASSRQNLCEGGLKVPLQLLPGCLPWRCRCLCFDTALLCSSRPECTGSLHEVAGQ